MAGQRADSLCGAQGKRFDAGANTEAMHGAAQRLQQLAAAGLVFARAQGRRRGLELKHQRLGPDAVHMAFEVGRVGLFTGAPVQDMQFVGQLR